MYFPPSLRPLPRDRRPIPFSFPLRSDLAPPSYHYHQVREEIAWLLFILMRNEFQLYANHPAASPGGRLSPPSGALSVLSSPVHLQFIHYVKAQFNAVRRMHREDKENPAGSPKIAAMAAEADGDGAAAESGAESDAAAGHIKQQQPACHVELA